MPRIIADSSTLILLAKCSMLKIFCDLFSVFIPNTVKAEVAAKELVKNYPDAALISDLILTGAIKVRKPGSAKLPMVISLHQGEEEALLLAGEMEKAVLATDDGKAIKAARFLRVPFIITPKIVVELFGLEKISLKKAKASIEKLGKIGRYSPDIIAEALMALMEVRHGKAHNYKDP